MIIIHLQMNVSVLTAVCFYESDGLALAYIMYVPHG